ncbi:hypothetical protein LOTGIDRAFT_175460 [Lottia gigantea]|uniref:PWWP domain-containing protein n=1 Tax=Lottia gigantea TaxID=225164 RepID=V4BZ29_LOTGI|nr:hypothetical protein LOTGIDRAFT_175460 [Lottia gigantea]ESO94384.1 hypothetical protein LOTGIDRAFT_175460 [Lottia gigantea]
MFVWAKIKGTPVMWPGKIMHKGQIAAGVYINSDDSVFTVKLSEIVPFNENMSKLRQAAIDMLLKKGKLNTLQCFMDDVQWALVAQNDVLIVALGECWLRQNIDNPLKRAHYSSQRMRLAARLLVELRKLVADTGNEKHMSMWDFIKPEFFDIMAQAALEVAIPLIDDEDELKSPSNCLKLKYDILRLTNFKWSFVVKGREQNDKERKDCKTFLHLMSLEFKTKVTKLAYTVLMKRQFTKSKDIPAPSDIEVLNKHLISELSTCSLNSSKENFFHIIKFLQCRLLSYNKRRSGEIDAISLRSFLSRRKELSDVDQSLIGELSLLEKHLLESQDLMIVRGKRGKPVPVIIPDDCRKPLEFIVNAEKAGVNKHNRFLFPNSVNGAIRSYESLKNICSDLNLKNPENITSVSMRKYTSTLTQVMDLNNNQMDWLCKHLGHTKRVHKDHYQQMSGFIERVKISKLLLVQDLNLTSKLAGKKLDDISLEDLILEGSVDTSNVQNIELNEHARKRPVSD